MKRHLNPTSVIKARLGIQDGGPVHAFFTQSCFKHMSPFVPGGTKSHLNQSVDITTDSITYQSIDAQYLYHGKLYVDPKYKKGAFYSSDYGYWSRPGIPKIPSSRNLEYHTPGTGAFWDKRMWASDESEIVKEVQNFVNKGRG
ncbi:MAG: minor capsid protein [Bacilli bacterium]